MLLQAFNNKWMNLIKELLVHLARASNYERVKQQKPTQVKLSNSVENLIASVYQDLELIRRRLFFHCDESILEDSSQ